MRYFVFVILLFVHYSFVFLYSYVFILSTPYLNSMLPFDESSESDMTVVSIEEESEHAHGETDPLLGQGESENSAGLNISQAEMEQRMSLLIELMRRMEEENNRPQRDVENQNQQDATDTLMNDLRERNIPITGLNIDS